MCKGRMQLRHCICLVCSTAFMAKTLPFFAVLSRVPGRGRGLHSVGHWLPVAKQLLEGPSQTACPFSATSPSFLRPSLRPNGADCAFFSAVRSLMTLRSLPLSPPFTVVLLLRTLLWSQAVRLQDGQNGTARYALPGERQCKIGLEVLPPATMAPREEEGGSGRGKAVMYVSRKGSEFSRLRPGMLSPAEQERVAAVRAAGYALTAFPQRFSLSSHNDFHCLSTTIFTAFPQRFHCLPLAFL